MQSAPRAVSRQAAIRWLREAVIKLTDECSRCQRATEHGIYCLGFRRFTEEELNRRYARLRDSNPKMTPEELADLANRWRVAIQFLQRVSAYCEARRREPGKCAGWDGFSNDELQQFCLQILREPVRVADERSPGATA